jgi:dTDP-4-dehydrorhamnose reductase
MFLIIGGDAQIGRAVVDTLIRSGTPALGTTRRHQTPSPQSLRLDLDAIAEDWHPPAATRAACIAAAVTRMAECAADPIGTSRINCTAAVELAWRLTAAGIYTLFLSTNQVFDGTVPYVRADARRCPVSVYGQQKAQAELALERMMAAGAPIGVLRLSKVLGPDMRLFADWRMALAAGRPVQAFEDMVLAPVPLGLAATAVAAMLRDQTPAIAQLSGPRDMSYVDAARTLARQAGADLRLVKASRTAGLPAGAAPAHTTLDSRTLRDRFSITAPDVDELLGALTVPGP